MGRACLLVLSSFSMLLAAGCGGSTCRDACDQAGQGRCSDGELQLCLEADGCLVWSEPLACSTDQTCQDGRCSLAPCQDSCEQAGQGRCADGALQLCLEADGCLVWSDPLDCGLGAHCDSGQCLPDACQDECDGWLTTRCASPDGVQTCVEVDGCLLWADPQACEPGQTCMDGRCQGCAGTVGSYSDRSMDVDGQSRAYFLHVPDAYQCDDAWPVLIHLHGTVVEYPRPEEAYGLDDMIDLADERGFIVVRPRSLSRDWGGRQVYQWDINPGDLEHNAAFVEALVASIRADYHIDPERIHVIGFSNGTNMAVQVLSSLSEPVAGVGLIGGGYWSAGPLPDLAAAPPRVCAVTGFRDYMYSNLRPLLPALAAAGLPPGHLRQRQADAGHEMYAWHLREIWDWLDRGEAPPSGDLLPPWSADDSFPADASLLEVEQAVDGGLVVAGAEGGLWIRPTPADNWAEATGLSDGFDANLTGLCLQPSGAGLAVGDGFLAATADGGATWSELDRLPDYLDSGFPSSYVIGLGCGADTMAFAGGYWAGAWTGDMGATWSAGTIPTQYGMDAQVADAAFAADGVAVAVGYPNYIGRSEDGQVYESRPNPLYVSWLNGVAAGPDGRFWVVGEAGTVLASEDGGLSWQDRSPDTSADLYAVAFLDDLLGMAVGSHGTALLTEDGGLTWQDVSTGLDGFLGDVVWTDADTVVAVGQGGAVLTYHR